MRAPLIARICWGRLGAAAVARSRHPHRAEVQNTACLILLSRSQCTRRQLRAGVPCHHHRENGFVELRQMPAPEIARPVALPCPRVMATPSVESDSARYFPRSGLRPHYLCHAGTDQLPRNPIETLTVGIRESSICCSLFRSVVIPDSLRLSVCKSSTGGVPAKRTRGTGNRDPQ